MRKRGNSWQLKIDVGKNRLNGSASVFQEITDPDKIAKKLKIESLSMLDSVGIQQYCKISTERSHYKKDEFTVVVDKCFYNDDKDFNYQICEVELVVKDKSYIKESEFKIEKFIRQHGFELKPVVGKLPYFLKVENPEIFSFLSKVYGFN
ncbi:MAG: hypothetical protein KatS3mg090_0098 [Patescibacteria group bacterium]|nr:MAG: hypothetical protein KatS3mg090_0098 [Patescibacteria group bacterium]